MKRPSALVLVVAITAGSATAQGLVGGAPDTSNWPHPASPAGNPFPRSTEPGVAQRDKTAQLGKTLFWEEQVSTDGTVACGTCHRPEDGGTDPQSLFVFHDPFDPLNVNRGNRGSLGVIAQHADSGGDHKSHYGSAAQDPLPQVTPVAAPTMIGAYLFDQLFWDLRAGPEFEDTAGAVFPGFGQDAALEALAVEPPLSSIEMGHELLTWQDGFLQAKLGASMPMAMVDPATIPPDIEWIVDLGVDYDSVFDSVFGTHSQFGGNVGVTRERFAMAIAHYQRTLIPDQAPIDLGTMTQDQIDGFVTLREQGCFTCHSATGFPQLDDQHRLVDPFDNLFSDGLSRSIFLQTEEFQPARKTPTLRNLGLKKKFFSNGQFTTHQQLMTFYTSPRPAPSGQVPNNTLVLNGLTPTELAQVEDFLFHALTDPRVANRLPPFDRPELHSETVTPGDNLFGTATPAPGASTPRMIANAPALIPPNGAPQWVKLGVHSADPGEPTAILFSLSKSGGTPVLLGDPVFTDLGPLVDADGFATYHQSAPMNPSLIDVKLYFQWLVGAGDDVSYSEGAELVPFQW